MKRGTVAMVWNCLWLAACGSEYFSWERETEPDAHPDSDADADSDSDTDTNTDADGDTDTETWAGCIIDGVLYFDGQSNPENECQACQQALTNTEWSNVDDIPCEQGDLCHPGKTCSDGACGGGDPVDCTFLGGPCTRAWCDPGDGTCKTEVVNEGLPCEDGNLCTAGEICENGVCAGGSQIDCTPWSLFVIGDTRTGHDIALANFKSMYAVDPGAAGCVNVGDLTELGSISVWDTHMQILADAAPDPSVPVDPLGIVRQSRFRTDVATWGDYIRYLGVLGNHDTGDWEGWYANWNKYLKGQKQLGQNSEDGIYFTVSFGETLLIALDSEHPSDAQAEWLEQVLKSPAAEKAMWKMAFFHEPVYPCNGKPPFSPGLRWVQMFEAHEVDIVFLAHSHTYERTCPMRDGRCVIPRGVHGVVYLNTSGGGGPVRDVWPDKKDTVTWGDISDSYDCSEILDVYRSYWYHFCHVTVDDCTLEIRCYPHDEYLWWGAGNGTGIRSRAWKGLEERNTVDTETDTDTGFLEPLLLDKCDELKRKPRSARAN